MVHRRMSRRSRRSKLRSRRTIRRGGRNCSSMNMAQPHTQTKEYTRIIAELARQYGKHPDHDYSEDVAMLQSEHCDKFLDDFAIFITRYKDYNKGGLKSFYDALVTRNLNKES